MHAGVSGKVMDGSARGKVDAARSAEGVLKKSQVLHNIWNFVRELSRRIDVAILSRYSP